MSNDNLPTIDIKGKPYTLVKDRILKFNEMYGQGAIHTEIVKYENGQVIVKAMVYPIASEKERCFIAHSQSKENDGYINKTSALENAETSSIGRALALMGIGVIESIASADEVNKAIAQPVDDSLNDDEIPMPEEEDTKVSNILLRCKKCGASAVKRSGNTNGRDWTGIYCSKDKSHVEWL